MRTTQKMWYWITGRTTLRGGRRQTVLLGAYATEDEANRKGFEAFDGIFKLHYLPTRDQSAATNQLKHILLEDTGSLSSSMERVGHQQPPQE